MRRTSWVLLALASLGVVLLAGCSDAERDTLRGHLAIGVQIAQLMLGDAPGRRSRG